MSEAEARAQGRREAAPAAFVALLLLVVLAVVSWARGWELLGLPWWTWLILGVPALLLTIDVSLTFSGSGLVRTRRAALLLLGLLVLGNFIALAILVAGLVTMSTQDLSGGELLLTGFTIWSTDVIVFALLFWELDSGGPVARIRVAARATPDFQFPQDENPQLAPKGWSSAGLGLRLPLTDQRHRVQPDRRDAAITTCEGDDGPRVGDLRRHRAARCRTRSERSRLVSRIRWCLPRTFRPPGELRVLNGRTNGHARPRARSSPASTHLGRCGVRREDDPGRNASGLDVGDRLVHVT